MNEYGVKVSATSHMDQHISPGHAGRIESARIVQLVYDSSMDESCIV